MQWLSGERQSRSSLCVPLASFFVPWYYFCHQTICLDLGNTASRKSTVVQVANKPKFKPVFSLLDPNINVWFQSGGWSANCVRAVFTPDNWQSSGELPETVTTLVKNILDCAADGHCSDVHVGKREGKHMVENMPMHAPGLKYMLCIHSTDS